MESKTFDTVFNEGLLLGKSYTFDYSETKYLVSL